MSSTLCSFTVASSGWSLFLLFAVLPVPILCSSSFPCVRDLQASLSRPFQLHKMFRFQSSSFRGCPLSWILRFIVGSFELFRVSDVSRNRSHGIVADSCHWCVGSGAWVSCCTLTSRIVSRVRVVGWSWSSTPLAGSDMQRCVSRLLGLCMPRIRPSCPSRPRNL